VALVNTTIEIDEPPDQVYARVVASVSMVSGYQVTGHPGLIVITRTYRPTWAIVLAIVGIFLCLLGLLFLLVQRTETVTVTFTPREPGGCTATVAGEVDDRNVAWLLALVSSPPPRPAQP